MSKKIQPRTDWGPDERQISTVALEGSAITHGRTETIVRQLELETKVAFE
jgi:hypothetical protein